MFVGLVAIFVVISAYFIGKSTRKANQLAARDYDLRLRVYNLHTRAIELARAERLVRLAIPHFAQQSGRNPGEILAEDIRRDLAATLEQEGRVLHTYIETKIAPFANGMLDEGDVEGIKAMLVRSYGQSARRVNIDKRLRNLGRLMPEQDAPTTDPN